MRVNESLAPETDCRLEQIQSDQSAKDKNWQIMNKCQYSWYKSDISLR